MGDEIDYIIVIVDPESGGFVDENGIPQEGILNEGPLTTSIQNALLSDDESEMLIRIPTENILIASLPIIELEQSVNNPGPFAFSAYGYKSSTMFLKQNTNRTMFPLSKIKSSGRK